eukprot:scaffold163326_cov18-Prasinocladus_malaysianus.AAC.1
MLLSSGCPLRKYATGGQLCTVIGHTSFELKPRKGIELIDWSTNVTEVKSPCQTTLTSRLPTGAAKHFNSQNCEQLCPN